jgi:hypothetical protein
MFKNGMRPVHPGEILLEDYIKPMGVSVRAISPALCAVLTPASNCPEGVGFVRVDGFGGRIGVVGRATAVVELKTLGRVSCILLTQL